ncbi:hypothetical protein [Mesonia sp. K7]|uniref:hypothetical protein n=1 Tax=Mesonia sp. K7 TaxID=2218606 RepID=UPI000DA76596|nr:hypothetical protein [Mesonia sp. K7]PZD79524.1 hypothetical protein DNG35_00510 [Mesonia sp. K7]
MNTIIQKTAFLTAFTLVTTLSFAQQKIEKLSESFKVDDHATLEFDAKNTVIYIETWNKDAIDISATLESEKLSKEELEAYAENWNIEAFGNSQGVSISSQVHHQNANDFVQVMRSDDFIEPMVSAFVMPVIENPSPANLSFYHNMSDLKFDYQAYEQRGEAYVKEYQKMVEERMEKDMLKFKEQFGGDFEKRMNEFAQRNEEVVKNWEESFKQRMEQMEQNLKMSFSQNPSVVVVNGQPNVNHEVITTPNGTMTTYSYSYQSSSPISVKRKLKTAEEVVRKVSVKIPKDAKVVLNTRYGALHLQDEIKNIDVIANHTPVKIAKVSGGNNSVNIAYAPLTIENWEDGNVVMKYVKEGKINNAQRIRINARSSNVTLGKIEESGEIIGSFGKLQVNSLGNNFNQLDINLHNSDLLIQLPQNAFNFSYNGSLSQIKMPENIIAKKMGNRNSELINGYFKSRDSESTILITAKYSDVTIK